MRNISFLISLGIILLNSCSKVGESSLFGLNKGKTNETIIKPQPKKISDPKAPDPAQEAVDILLNSNNSKIESVLDALPNLPIDAGKKRPTSEDVTLEELCLTNKSTLQKVVFNRGVIGTDGTTDYAIFLRDKFDYGFLLGKILLEKKNYYIVFQKGREIPVFYVDFETKPKISNFKAGELKPSFDINEESSVLTNILFDEHNHQIMGNQFAQNNSFGEAPKCGKINPPNTPPVTPDPTEHYSLETLQNDDGKYSNQELTIYYAQVEANVDMSKLKKKMQETGKCITAYQVLKKAAQLTSLTSKPLLSKINSSGKNNIEGRTLRASCDERTAVAMTQLGNEGDDQTKLYGLRTYVVKLVTTIGLNDDQNSLHLNPLILYGNDGSELPSLNHLKLSPYVTQIEEFPEINKKVLTAFIPIGDLFDCQGIREKAGVAGDNLKRTSEAMEKLGLSNTTLDYEIEIAHNGDEENNGNAKCKGKNPLSSPLVIHIGEDSLLTTKKAPLSFDLNGDGIKESVSGWPKAMDFKFRSKTGFLIVNAHKKYEKKSLSGVNLLGHHTDYSFLKNIRNAPFSDGHDALSALDVNNDGSIDQKDRIELESNGKEISALKILSIWFDFNQDGIKQRNEIQSLEGYGIKALSTKVESVGEKVRASGGKGSITTESAVIFKKSHKKLNGLFKVYDLWLESK